MFCDESKGSKSALLSICRMLKVILTKIELIITHVKKYQPCYDVCVCPLKVSAMLESGDTSKPKLQITPQLWYFYEEWHTTII